MAQPSSVETFDKLNPEKIQMDVVPAMLSTIKHVKTIICNPTPDSTICLIEDAKEVSEHQRANLSVLKVRTDRNRLLVRNEANLLLHLRANAHPNIIRIYGAFYQSVYSSIHMEYFDHGTIGQPKAPLNDRALVDLMRQVAGGLDYLHGNEVVHCDIKPRNIGVQKVDGYRYVAKIIDFRRAVKIPLTIDVEEIDSSRQYRAPEALHLNGRSQQLLPVEPSLDMWSFAMTLQAVFHPRVSTPWAEASPEDANFRHFVDEMRARPHGSSSRIKCLTGRELRPIFYRAIFPNLLVCDPAKRWTSKKVKEVLDQHLLGFTVA